VAGAGVGQIDLEGAEHLVLVVAVDGDLLEALLAIGEARNVLDIHGLSPGT
jgi:hypothetical protein